MKIRISLKDGSDRILELSDVQSIEFVDDMIVEPVAEEPVEPIANDASEYDSEEDDGPIVVPVEPVAEEPVEPIANPHEGAITPVYDSEENGPVEPVAEETVAEDVITETVEESINQLRANLRRMLRGRNIVQNPKPTDSQEKPVAEGSTPEPTLREY